MIVQQKRDDGREAKITRVEITPNSATEISEISMPESANSKFELRGAPAKYPPHKAQTSDGCVHKNRACSLLLARGRWQAGTNLLTFFRHHLARQWRSNRNVIPLQSVRACVTFVWSRSGMLGYILIYNSPLLCHSRSGNAVQPFLHQITGDFGEFSSFNWPSPGPSHIDLIFPVQLTDSGAMLKTSKP